MKRKIRLPGRGLFFASERRPAARRCSAESGAEPAPALPADFATSCLTAPTSGRPAARLHPEFEGVRSRSCLLEDPSWNPELEMPFLRPWQKKQPQSNDRRPRNIPTLRRSSIPVIAAFFRSPASPRQKSRSPGPAAERPECRALGRHVAPPRRDPGRPLLGGCRDVGSAPRWVVLALFREGASLNRPRPASPFFYRCRTSCWPRRRHPLAFRKALAGLRRTQTVAADRPFVRRPAGAQALAAKNGRPTINVNGRVGRPFEGDGPCPVGRRHLPFNRRQPRANPAPAPSPTGFLRWGVFRSPPAVWHSLDPQPSRPGGLNPIPLGRRPILGRMKPEREKGRESAGDGQKPAEPCRQPAEHTDAGGVVRWVDVGPLSFAGRLPAGAVPPRAQGGMKRRARTDFRRANALPIQRARRPRPAQRPALASPPATHRPPAESAQSPVPDVRG